MLDLISASFSILWGFWAALCPSLTCPFQESILTWKCLKSTGLNLRYFSWLITSLCTFFSTWRSWGVSIKITSFKTFQSANNIIHYLIYVHLKRTMQQREEALWRHPTEPSSHEVVPLLVSEVSYTHRWCFLRTHVRNKTKSILLSCWRTVLCRPTKALVKH